VSARIAICAAQIPFIRGGAEVLYESLRDELVRRGHRAEIVSLPFKLVVAAEHRAECPCLADGRPDERGRTADRPGDRHAVPVVSGASSAQGGLVDPPVSPDLRPQGDPVQRLRRARRGSPRPRAMLRQLRPARPGRGQRALLDLAQHRRPAWRASTSSRPSRFIRRRRWAAATGRASPATTCSRSAGSTR
jgi:hypothetical protein